MDSHMTWAVIELSNWNEAVWTWRVDSVLNERNLKQIYFGAGKGLRNVAIIMAGKSII